MQKNRPILNFIFIFLKFLPFVLLRVILHAYFAFIVCIYFGYNYKAYFDNKRILMNELYKYE